MLLTCFRCFKRVVLNYTNLLGVEFGTCRSNLSVFHHCLASEKNGVSSINYFINSLQNEYIININLCKYKLIYYKYKFQVWEKKKNKLQLSFIS